MPLIPTITHALLRLFLRASSAMVLIRVLLAATADHPFGDDDRRPISAMQRR